MVTTKKGGATWHGFLPADDPFYTKGGWNFLAAANLPKKTAADDDTHGGDGRDQDDGEG